MSEHHPTLTTSRSSACVECSCGWVQRIRVTRGRSAAAASVAFAEHLRLANIKGYNSYDQGGILKPGSTMAQNNTGGNEVIA